MHKICAQVTIIEPVVSVNHFVTDAAISLKIAMDFRNGVDEIERVMVISSSWNNQEIKHNSCGSKIQVMHT